MSDSPTQRALTASATSLAVAVACGAMFLPPIGMLAADLYVPRLIRGAVLLHMYAMMKELVQKVEELEKKVK